MYQFTLPLPWQYIEKCDFKQPKLREYKLLAWQDRGFKNTANMAIKRMNWFCFIGTFWLLNYLMLSLKQDVKILLQKDQDIVVTMKSQHWYFVTIL